MTDQSEASVEWTVDELKIRGVAATVDDVLDRLRVTHRGNENFRLAVRGERKHAPTEEDPHAFRWNLSIEGVATSELSTEELWGAGIISESAYWIRRNAEERDQ